MTDKKENTRFYNRDKWPQGEWDNEPDEDSWVDEKTGLQCAIVRNYSGALCGYVGMPNSSPHHGTRYDSIEIDGKDWGPDVHGGLTYSSEGGKSFLREAMPDLTEDLWWLGFDCSHSGDVMPGMSELHSVVFGHASYKNLEYVKSEVASLAQQLAAPVACEGAA